MKRSLFFISSLIFVLLASVLYAQEEQCSQNLEEAQLRYDEGRIQDIEGLVLRCLDNGTYDKAQSEQAMRLLILSYIFQGEDGKADTTMLRLLRRSHEFTPDETLDPVEFINLYNTYRTKPIFRVGVKAGANMTLIQANKIYTTGQPASVGEREFEYSPKQGVTFGAVFEYEFHPRFTIYPEILYSTRTFDNAEEFLASTDPTDVIDTKEETERQTWIELPVSVQYRFIDGNIRPYVNIGGAVSYLNQAEYPTNDNFLNRQDAILQNTLGEVTQHRNIWNFYAFLGGGVKLKVGEGYIVAELRANYGITEVSTGKNAFSPDYGDFSNGQTSERIVPDAYQMHFGTFTLGYTLNLYKPKKL